MYYVAVFHFLITLRKYLMCTHGLQPAMHFPNNTNAPLLSLIPPTKPQYSFCAQTLIEGKIKL